MFKKILIMGILFGFIGCSESQSIELEGRIAMKGNAIHNYLTIYDEKTKKSYKIENTEAFHLLRQQNKTIHLEARLIKEAMGPGYPAVIEVLNIK